jgi:general secretion pathway protein H
VRDRLDGERLGGEWWGGDVGFTLLEMIVVLVILGLMAGLVVSRGPSRSAGLDLRAAATEITQTLRGARARAISTDRTVVFRVNPAAHVFTIDAAPPRRLPATIGVTVIALSGDVERDRTADISFAPDGSSSGGRIDLVSGARHMQIDVAWLTGRVTAGDASGIAQ